MFKKKKVDKYEPIMPCIGTVDDYHIYQMTIQNRIMGFLIGFAIGAVATYLFFNSIIFSAICGIFGGIYIQKPYGETLRKKRIKILRLQFKDMLESLSSSYTAGRNTMEAFDDCYDDLSKLYGNQADIVKELHAITTGIRSNINIEELLRNFAKRSEIEDIESFADVFEISFRQGANIKEVIAATRMVLADKMEIEMEIETLITGGKNELNIMMVMPFIVIISLGGLGDSMTITSNSALNIVIKAAVLGLFAVAYKLGRKITDIKV